MNVTDPINCTAVVVFGVFFFFFSEVNVAEGCDEKRMKMGAWRGTEVESYVYGAE